MFAGCLSATRILVWLVAALNCILGSVRWPFQAITGSRSMLCVKTFWCWPCRALAGRGWLLLLVTQGALIPRLKRLYVTSTLPAGPFERVHWGLSKWPTGQVLASDRITLWVSDSSCPRDRLTPQTIVLRWRYPALSVRKGNKNHWVKLPLRLFEHQQVLSTVSQNRSLQLTKDICICSCVIDF